MKAVSFEQARRELWDHMAFAHNLTLLDSEMWDIIHLAVKVNDAQNRERNVINSEARSAKRKRHQ